MFDILQGDPWFPTILPFAAIPATYALMIVNRFRERAHARKMERWAATIQERAARKLLHQISVGDFAVNAMSTPSAYKTYIDKLSLQTRHELIDKILQNQARKSEAITGFNGPITDMAALVSLMRSVELETIVYLIDDNFRMRNDEGIRGQGQAYLQYTNSDLANDIIAFRLRNPY